MYQITVPLTSTTVISAALLCIIQTLVDMFVTFLIDTVPADGADGRVLITPDSTVSVNKEKKLEFVEASMQSLLQHAVTFSTYQ